MIWRLGLAYLSCALGTGIGVMAASSTSLLGFVDVGSFGVPLFAFASLPARNVGRHCRLWYRHST